MALYYMSGDGSSVHFLWNNSPYYDSVDQASAGRWAHYAGILLALLAPAFIFLYKHYKRTMLFWSAVYLAVLTPIVWIGEEHNELIFKCSVIIHFSLSLLYASLFVHTRHKVARAALAVFMLIGMAGSVGDIGLRVLAHYSWDESAMKENTREKRLGDMREPEMKLYRRFHGEKPISPVLYSLPGEAAGGSLRFMSADDNSKETLPRNKSQLQECANGQDDITSDHHRSANGHDRLAK